MFTEVKTTMNNMITTKSIPILVNVKPLIMTLLIASDAYLIGKINDNTFAQVSRESSGISPEKKICGITTSGMNCISWNSDLTKVDRSRPAAIATSDSRNVVNRISQMDPTTSMFNTLMVNNTISTVWNTAIKP